MDREEVRKVALEALAEYKENKIFSLEKVQAIYDAVGLDIKLDPHDKADQAVMALLLHLHFN
ncbi:hypothetical protein [Serratia proteamaculans]|uniref:hypothetical protein n=1 Tax=Serratia TaxID=613 RepID=UPI0010220933|nr:hypothetical protein [Serratia proteamaculans]RYM47684.1 hypothetical protein BSQ97_24300 [Serratia proteamaculans]